MCFRQHCEDNGENEDALNSIERFDGHLFNESIPEMLTMPIEVIIFMEKYVIIRIFQVLLY